MGRSWRPCTADLEQNVDIPARGGLHSFLPGQSSSSSSRMLVKGVFALIPVRKKCDVGSALGVGTECGLYSVHSGCLCGLYWAADVGRRRWVRLVAVGVWPVVPGQGPFYLVGRSWVTWWRRLEVASAVLFLGLMVVVPVVQVVLRTGGSGRFLLQFIDKLWTSLAVCWRRREGVAAGAFSPGVGVSAQALAHVN